MVKDKNFYHLIKIELFWNWLKTDWKWEETKISREEKNALSKEYSLFEICYYKKFAQILSKASLGNVYIIESSLSVLFNFLRNAKLSIKKANLHFPIFIIWLKLSYQYTGCPIFFLGFKTSKSGWKHMDHPVHYQKI